MNKIGKVKISKPISFWCAMGIGKQQAFREDGSRYEISVELPVGKQHILHNGMLICKASREAIKGRFKTKKQKTSQLRIAGLEMCPDCEKGFKAHPDLGWSKWVSSLHSVKQVNNEASPLP